MSNKLILIVVGVIALIGLLGGGYLLLNNNQAQYIAPQELAGLIESGQPLKCEVNQQEDEGTVVGTLYFAGERIRGSFTTIQGEDEYSADIIQDGIYGYTWGETPYGTMAVKMMIEDEEIEENEVVDLDDHESFTCETWIVDESMFNLPTDIEFTDITEQIEQMEEGAGLLDDAQCDACELIEDSTSREMCLQTLGCV